jgi:hypothetical protein
MIDKLQEIINSCPYSTEFGKFEQENFLSPAAPGYPRYIIGLINRHRKIVSDLEQETRTFERNCLQEEKSKIEEILSQQDPVRLQNAIDNWEKVESEYWVDTLGKMSAIEILTHGKVTYETMMKLAKLPEDMYIKSTQICVKLANKIKETTVVAEEAIGVLNQEPATLKVNPSVPKKLFLKKTK